jgi:DNA-binding protein HU-beta
MSFDSLVIRSASAALAEVRVNKGELIDAVSERTGQAKKDVEHFLNHFLEVVKDEVKKGEKVTVPGFGSWARTDRKAREGRNPRTGETVQIAASKGVKFTPGSQFKSHVKEA